MVTEASIVSVCRCLLVTERMNQVVFFLTFMGKELEYPKCAIVLKHFDDHMNNK
jgi:hypothetical protein